MAATKHTVLAGQKVPVGSHSVQTDSKAENNVLDATFITHTIPDILSPNASILGLCTVSNDRADISDQGWHIADFLAYKALLCGETHPKAQTWLAHCDILSLANAWPENYAHGRGRRLVNDAAGASSYLDRRGNLLHRDDQIKVEPDPQRLATEFVKTLSEKSEIAKKMGFPIIVIICGPTTLEQDVFFGETEAKHCVKSELMRQTLGDDVDAIVITPALFSSGWQVNPSFCRPLATKARAGRTEFFARQFGGVFAKGIVEGFLDWKCPFLDLGRIDEREKNETLYPGPALPSYQQKLASEALRVKIHSALAGRLSARHSDHSFDFEGRNDEWEVMIGQRKHKPLSHYQQKWAKLPVATTPATVREGFRFLGDAFGGTKVSQANHIRHLIKESFVAWSGYWSLPFGQAAGGIFQAFLYYTLPNDLDYHEVFNIMEHRATLAVLADATTRHFNFPRPYGQRCRDWDELKWTKESPESVRLGAIQSYGELTKLIPGVNLPPGVNYNHLSKVQGRLPVPISYLAASLCVQSAAGTNPRELKSISNFFEEVRVRQVKILLEDPEVQTLCVAWLSSIQMPIRQPGIVLAARASNSKAAQVSPASGSQPLKAITNAPSTAMSTKKPGESVPSHLQGMASSTMASSTRASGRLQPSDYPRRNEEW